jgi:putative protein-disulfide isomerase
MEKPRIVYIYDALCGWCYGFSPVIRELHTHYQDQFDFEVLSGGMILGERAGAIGKVASYISRAYKQVEEVTGVAFGEGFLKGVLEPGTAYFSSEKPGIAMTVFKQVAPEHSLAFAHDLQQAIYFEGCDLNAPETYADLVAIYNIDPQAFVNTMQSEEAIERTYDEFQFVGEMGIGGFPTVLVVSGTEGYVLSRGYQPYEEIEKSLLQLQEQLF